MSKKHKYSIITTLSITGTFEVMAENRAQAKEYIEKHCGLVLGGNIHSSLPDEDIDWNFPTHFTKEIPD